LTSLGDQTHRNFELIVVDQNPDDRLEPILSSYADNFPIVHLRTDRRGLSRAKNLGLTYASGDIVGFPDDNCLFPPRLLEEVARFFADHPEVDGLTGRSVDEDGADSNGRYDVLPGAVDKFNVWRRGIAYNIFLRRESIGKVRFDEELGPGAGTAWGAGDETDFLLRLLDQGVSLRYGPTLVVVHPQPVPPYDAAARRRAYAYGCGIGHVLRRHRYPPGFVASWLIRPLGATVVSLACRTHAEAAYHRSTFEGRVRGLLS
jgi:glycosyltransferase involved in cell wall biosynthesis